MRFFAALALTLAAIPVAGAAERVLVAGATGRTGSAIVAELKKAGYVVRALARDVEKAKRDFGADVEWVAADVRNADQIKAAFAGQIDYAVSAIGSREWTGPNSAQFVDYLGTRNLIEAAKAAKVRHFVMISTGSIGPHQPQADNATIGYVGYWKTRGEDAVKSSGVPYTIIGPGGLREMPGGAVGIKVMARKDYRTAQFTIGDSALLAVDALKNPAQRNKAYAAVSDEALPVGAWKDALAAMPTEVLALPPVSIDEKNLTALEVLDAPDAPIQRFMLTGYGILPRQSVAIPGSNNMFCALSNDVNVLLNWFPRDKAWKFEILYNENRTLGSGALATCHRIAMP
jgi:uncharacterized protein YbjT (DUF2867 family)